MTAAGHAPVAAIRNMTSRLESERAIASMGCTAARRNGRRSGGLAPDSSL